MKWLWKLLQLIFGSKPRQLPDSTKEKTVDVPLLNGRDDKEQEMPDVAVKNNASRLNTEWFDLEEKNPDLYQIIEDAHQYAWTTYKKGLIITMIGRTEAEQDAIYAGTARGKRNYDEKPWKSPHQFWHAVDIRTSIFTTKEVAAIRKYINDKYTSKNYYKSTAMYHEVKKADGTKLGKHFHIQYWPKGK